MCNVQEVYRKKNQYAMYHRHHVFVVFANYKRTVVLCNEQEVGSSYLGCRMQVVNMRYTGDMQLTLKYIGLLTVKNYYTILHLYALYS